MGLPRGGLDGVDFAEATKRAAEAIENGFISYRQTEKAKLRGTSKVGGKDSGLCRILHKLDHVGLWIMSDKCALLQFWPTLAGVWTLSDPT